MEAVPSSGPSITVRLDHTFYTVKGEVLLVLMLVLLMMMRVKAPRPGIFGY